jgi:hypothetical protein
VLGVKVSGILRSVQYIFKEGKIANVVGGKKINEICSYF